MHRTRIFIVLVFLSALMAASRMARAQLSITNGMVPIPAGTFTMGDSLDGEADAPLTTVNLNGFFMDSNLVSSAVWQPILLWGMSNGYSFVHTGTALGANYPTESIDWYDAAKWCNARSQQAGQTPVYYTDAGLTVVFKSGEPSSVYANWNASGYRLPTEAEWEYAARGGLNGLRFPWSNTISFAEADYYGDPYFATKGTGYAYDLAYTNGVNPMWYVNTGFSTNANTSIVGYYPPNNFGLCDMAGNVFEWCWDYYGNYGPSPQTNPHGPDSGTNRIVRGGSWTSTPNLCRTACRGDFMPTFMANYFGFRTVLPEIAFATITVQAAPTNEGVVTGGGIVLTNTLVTNNAVPNAGDLFINWTVNGTVVSTNTPYIFTAASNETLVANFAPITYTLTLAASPPAGGTLTGGGTFLPNTVVTNTATPNPNYNFVNWTINGNVVGTSTTCIVTLTSNETLVANFTPIIYNVTVSASPANGGFVSGGGSLAAGTTNTVTATASNGWTFADWTVNGSVVSTSSNYTFVVSGNFALVANFTPILYTLTVASSPVAGGTVSGGGTFAANSVVTNTAFANANYQFVNWTINGVVVSTNGTYTQTLTGNETLVANFAPIIDTITVTASPVAGGIVTGGGGLPAGSTNTVSATPNNGYTFADWTVNGSIVSTSSNYTFVASGNYALVANFIPVYDLLTLSASPSTGGTVSGGGSIQAYSVVTNIATPASGYQFVSWTLNSNVVSTSSNYIFLLTNSESLVANFTPIIYTITVAASPTNAGTVSGGGSFNAGVTNTVIATPTNGYALTNWTVNGIPVSAATNYTFIVSSNESLVANFVPIIYTVSVSASPPAGGTVTGGGTFGWGASVTNSAAPNPGYTFSNWTANGVPASTAATYIFNVTNNETLVANFAPIPVVFTYAVTNGAVTITGYTGAGGAVTVPPTIVGLPVTGIAAEAFWNLDSITSMTLPPSITNIGEEAFWNCTALTTVTLPEGLTNITEELFWNCTALVTIDLPTNVTSIGVESFWNCNSLTNITVPPSVTNIGDAAFSDCYSLTSIVIPNSVTTVGAGAFNDCYSLTNVTIGTGLTQIANGVFAGTSLASVVIPNSVTSIGQNAFSSCSGLTNLTIPQSVTTIGAGAFSSCPLTAVYFTGNAPTTGAAAFANDAATVYYLAGTTGWGSTFAGRPAIMWNPSIQNVSFAGSTKKLSFTVSGPANIPIIVQACTNLTNGNWTNIQSCTLTNGSISFTDPSGTNGPARYYRIFTPYP